MDAGLSAGERRAPLAGAPALGSAPGREALLSLVLYFLKLGTIGFGGPVALVGYMHRDLVERRRLIGEETYRLGLAFAQIMPGPLAAQCAIALGYLEQGALGATLVGLAFVLPSFLMVVALSMAYVAFGGLWWMQALFYGIGAAVIGIIAIAAYKLARTTNKRDPLLWGIFAVLFVVTVLAKAELAACFILAGSLVLVVRAPPTWLRERLPLLARTAQGIFVVPVLQVAPAAAEATNTTLVDILLFFAKAGAFVFGSGLAVVPFLYQGVVQDYRWLTEQQFTDAVAVAMITPGPVVITVAFIGYLVAGFPGATLAAVGVFLPCWLFTILPAPYFNRFADDVRLKAFISGITAGATGAIAGATIVLAKRAIIDLPTLLIFAVTLACVVWIKKLPEPVVIAGAGIVAILLF
jgi:chromate transporter